MIRQLLCKFKMWKNNVSQMPDDKVEAVLQSMKIYNEAGRYTPWYSMPVWCKDSHEVFIGYRNRETHPDKIKWASLKGNKHDHCFWGDGKLKKYVITPNNKRHREVEIAIHYVLNPTLVKSPQQLEKDRLANEFMDFVINSGKSNSGK